MVYLFVLWGLAWAVVICWENRHHFRDARRLRDIELAIKAERQRFHNSFGKADTLRDRGE